MKSRKEVVSSPNLHVEIQRTAEPLNAIWFFKRINKVTTVFILFFVTCFSLNEIQLDYSKRVWSIHCTWQKTDLHVDTTYIVLNVTRHKNIFTCLDHSFINLEVTEAKQVNTYRSTRKITWKNVK